MFCTKCGNKLKDGAKFCEKCGNPVQLKSEVNKNEKQDSNETILHYQVDQNEENKDNNTYNNQNNKKFIIAALGGIALVIAVILVYGIFFAKPGDALSFLSFGSSSSSQPVKVKNKVSTKKVNKPTNKKVDTDKEDNVKLGTTSGNLTNCSFVFEKNGAIYYSNFTKQYKLYEMNYDSSNPMQLNNDDSGYFTQNGDYIYYTNASDGGKIYNIGTNGSGRKKICEDKSSYLEYADGYIYYRNESDGSMVYKIKEDGTAKEKVSRPCDLFNIDSNFLYYLKDGILKRKNLKTGDEIKIGDTISTIVVQDSTVYFTDNSQNKLYKMKNDGSDKIKICDDQFGTFNVNGNKIFYRNRSDNSKLYSIDLDGNNKQKISDISVALIISAGDYVYCNATDKTMFKVKKDGTDEQSIAQ